MEICDGQFVAPAAQHRPSHARRVLPAGGVHEQHIGDHRIPEHHHAARRHDVRRRLFPDGGLQRCQFCGLRRRGHIWGFSERQRVAPHTLEGMERDGLGFSVDDHLGDCCGRHTRIDLLHAGDWAVTHTNGEFASFIASPGAFGFLLGLLWGMVRPRRRSEVLSESNRPETAALADQLKSGDDLIRRDVPRFTGAPLYLPDPRMAAAVRYASAKSDHEANLREST